MCITDDYQTAHLLSIIVELLTFCIEHHAHHIKTYVTNKNLIQRVLVLLKSKHAFLALGIFSISLTFSFVVLPITIDIGQLDCSVTRPTAVAAFGFVS